MNWSDEQYVKVYKRETLTILSLDWDARSVLRALLIKLDGAGVMETGNMDQAEAIALQLRAPVDVVRRAMPALIACGTVVEVRNGILLPNFVAAQEATKTERLKKADQRQREADQRRFAQLNGTTEGDVPRSPAVSRAVPLQPSPAQPSPPPPPAQPTTSPAQLSPAKKRGKAQGQLPIVPPKPSPEPTVVQRLHAYFAEERTERLIAPKGELKGLGLPEPIPDDTPNWPRITAAVNEWLALWPAEEPEYQERLCRLLINAYLDDPHWATATRWDRKGNDTGELQPYPLRVLLSKKVYLPLFEKLEAELSGTPVPGGVH